MVQAPVEHVELTKPHPLCQEPVMRGNPFSSSNRMQLALAKHPQAEDGVGNINRATLLLYQFFFYQ